MHRLTQALMNYYDLQKAPTKPKPPKKTYEEIKLGESKLTYKRDPRGRPVQYSNYQ